MIEERRHRPDDSMLSEWIDAHWYAKRIELDLLEIERQR